ncbi:hypothetical protein [Myroides odoratus]|uniref:hypothetical protein n=1 Tax=Myroides odoratus TaxID=256 RepID=UPI0039AEB051
MKKILGILAVLLIFSCSKSDDNGDKTLDNQFYGKWYLVKEDHFDKNSKLLATISLKAGEHCDYDQLDFLPTNRINYLAYYLTDDTKECYSRYIENAYQWKMIDQRRLTLYNGEVRQEFIVTKIDDAEMNLERMLTAMEINSDNYEKGVVRIRIYYQKVK